MGILEAEQGLYVNRPGRDLATAVAWFGLATCFGAVVVTAMAILRADSSVVTWSTTVAVWSGFVALMIGFPILISDRDEVPLPIERGDL